MTQHARHGEPHYSEAWFLAVYYFFAGFYRLLYRLRVTGREHIPQAGGYILAPNHRSYADPPLAGIAAGRHDVHFMAKQELFDIPVLGYVIRRTHAFPVRRGEQDLGAFKRALRLLGAGKSLVMFPEGTRSKTDDLRPPQVGVAMMASRAGVPVVPAAILNAHRLLSFPRVEVRFGAPLTFDEPRSPEGYRRFSERLMSAIAGLRSL